MQDELQTHVLEDDPGRGVRQAALPRQRPPARISAWHRAATGCDRPARCRWQDDAGGAEGASPAARPADRFQIQPLITKLPKRTTGFTRRHSMAQPARRAPYYDNDSQLQRIEAYIVPG